MQFVFFLWMWNKNMRLPIHSLFLVRCAMSCNGGCSTIWTVIPNKGHGQLSPELSMAHWFGVDFVPLFHIEDVCVCYWNLCGPEEQFNHHLSDLQMKQYVAAYCSKCRAYPPPHICYTMPAVEWFYYSFMIHFHLLLALLFSWEQDTFVLLVMTVLVRWHLTVLSLPSTVGVV